MPAALKAVTFDYWQTMLYEEPGGLVSGRLSAWAGLLEEAGAPVEMEILRLAHQSAFDQASASWRAGVQYTADHAGRHVLDRLGVEVPGDVARAFVEAYSSAGSQTVLHVADGLPATLERLRDLGIGLGIVCDVGLTPSPVLREHLDRRDLLQFFDAWAFSDEVGEYKPHRKPFEHVLSALDVDDRGAAAHVGDNRRTDVAGARAMGMTSVRYRGVFDDTSDWPEADIVVAHHDELLQALLRDST